MNFKKLIAPVAIAALAAAAFTTLDTSADAQTPEASELGATELGAGSFSVSVGNASAKVGEQAAITITVTAGSGFKCNDGYPHRVKKLAGDGVEFGSKSVPGAVSGKSIRFSVPVTPTAAGAHAVTGQVKFSVCNDKSCHIKKVPLNATVTGT